MSMDMGAVSSVEFFVCCGALRDGDLAIVPVDASVQDLLVTMVRDTMAALQSEDAEPLSAYEPSQQHGADDRLALPLSDALAVVFRELYERENLQRDADVIRNPAVITAYGCILHDQRNEKLLAIRRAATFKGILRARLIRFIDDSLKAVPDDVFKLDADFDILVADSNVLIHRALAFELLAEIDEQVQAAAVSNTQSLAQRLSFLAFEQLVPYVRSHKRAARLVAALRARNDLGQTSLPNFKRECKRSGVMVKTIDGKLCPESGHELAFLQMLDRRRYALSLIAGKWEQYEAANRKETGVRVRETLRVPEERTMRAGR